MVTAGHHAHLAETGRRFRDAQAACESATAERREAILAAYRDGWTLNDIAAAVGAGHEPVRRVVRTAGL